MLSNIYKVLACQYDPLGYIIPFTTRAKILVRNFGRNKSVGMTRSSHKASMTDGLPGKFHDVMHQLPQTLRHLPRKGLWVCCLSTDRRLQGGSPCLLCPCQVPCGAKEAAFHVMARVECSTQWGSNSKCTSQQRSPYPSGRSPFGPTQPQFFTGSNQNPVHINSSWARVWPRSSVLRK